MSIARMKKLQMIVPRKDERKLIRALSKLGCFEIEKNDDWQSDPELAALLSRNSTSGDNAKALSEVSQSIENLRKHAGIKKSLFEPPAVVTEQQLAAEAPSGATLAAVAAINEAAKRLYALGSARAQAQAQKASLSAWLSSDVPLDTKGGLHYTVVFGSCPSAFDFNEIKKAAETDLLADVELVSSSEELHYMIITAHMDSVNAVLDQLKPFGFSETSFSGLSGTAAEEDAEIDENLRSIEAESLEYKEKIASYAGAFTDICKAYDYYSTQSSWDELESGAPSTKTVSLICGWTPDYKAESVMKVAEEHNAICELSDPTEDDAPPTLLENGSFVRPFGQVTSLYGMPAYDSLIDPNPMVAISYFLFFGLMFSDAAYGLILFLGCLIFLKKARPLGGMKRFITMFELCGISTFIWGALFGSWFGDIVNVVSERITGTAFAMPAVLNPLENPIPMLVLSLGLGVVHLYSGMIMNIIRQFKRKQYLDIIFDELTWMIAIPCIVLSFLGYSFCLYIALAMIVIVALTGGRDKKGLGKFTGGFSAVYNGATGNLSDILSYSRLMALAMSTGVIAQVMNTLGNMGGNSVLGWIFLLIVFCIGQVFNFAISILGAFVHSCRLQFVELFGRFYEDGGREFKPLAYKTKYVEIKED